MRFHPRLPNDTATLLLLASFLIVLLGLSASLRRPGGGARRWRSPRSARSCCWSSTRSGCAPTCAPTSSGPRRPRRRGHAPPLSLRGALVLLAIAGVGAAFVSDWFVAALDPAIDALHLSKAFAGLVIVAIAGNAVENVAGITLAAKGKMDDAISVVKNSVAQIAAFLFPALVLISLLFTPHADVRARPGLHRRAAAHRARRLAGHRRRRGDDPRGRRADRHLPDARRS